MKLALGAINVFFLCNINIGYLHNFINPCKHEERYHL